MWNRKGQPENRISANALAAFGRFEFLGEESGISVSDALGLVSGLNELIFTQDAADRARAVAELRRHATKGEWERVGAWKYVREFMSEDADTRELIDGGLSAVRRMRVTNLAIHLAPVDVPRYVELTGERPPHDGFFGPPVFDSGFGPSRQFYFDDAVAAARRRRIERLPAAAGSQPGPLQDAVRAMWDFGLLICRGPRVVNPDIRFEPNVVRPAVLAASGVDHGLFADGLADAALAIPDATRGPWTCIGGARFIEDYLVSSSTETPGYARLLDAGLTTVMEAGALDVSFPRAVLTTRQLQRLAALQRTSS